MRNALDAGVSGYILKNALETDLIRAVRTVAAGGRFLSPELASRASPARQARMRMPRTNAFVELSAREIQVLRLIALGRSNKEIARTARRQREHRGRAPHQPDGDARRAQGRRAGADCGAKGAW